MAILNGSWGGQPFRLQGTHYHVEEMTFLPTPVQHVLATWDIRSEKLETCAKKIEKGQLSAQCTCRRKSSNQAAGRRLLSLPMGGKRDREDTHAYLTKIHETLTAIRVVPDNTPLPKGLP